MTDTQELRACPFCGGAPEIERRWGVISVDCKKCFAGAGQHDTDADAIAAWNTRASDGVGEIKQALGDVLSGYKEYDQRLCCDGRECGCKGSTAFEAIEHYFGLLLEDNSAALSTNETAMREDAEKWRALMACQRIRMMGATRDLNHIGMEFWREHPEAHPSEKFPQEPSREKFEQFVSKALAGDA